MQDGSRRRARLILILGIVLAIAAGGGTFFYASSATTAGPAQVIPTVGVLVAAREIPPKTTITQADVRVQEYNQDAKPLTALSGPAQAVGQISVVPIAVGEPILASKLNDPKSPIFVVIPPTALDPNGNITPQTPNYRALSITVPDANAVGGALVVGDLVDVVFTMQIDPQRFFNNPPQTLTPDFNAKIILERVPILARTAAVYTIRADAITAETMTYLQVAGGQLHMFLRAPRDERASGSTGTTFEDMYGRMSPAINRRLPPPAQ